MRTKKATHQTTATIIILFIALSPIFIAGAQSLQITASSEYNQFVHTTINSDRGNITALDKPIFPIMLNNSQIQIGQNWTITCPLEANHNYHVYCYGAWTNTQTEAKTDYDIYVYDPSGTLVSSHTEAAGVIEYINSLNDENLFTPTQTGNYSFMIRNDARESQGAQQATFMIIENIQCNQWYTSTIQGKTEDSSSNPKTTWAYEFTTNASLLEVYLTIPDALDMYETRLLLMNDGSGPTVNSNPLAVESGLFGNVSGGSVGGYNFDTNGSRGVAYASCEYSGEDMRLTYAPATAGTKLYHLALIGEDGQGEVKFMIKTAFENITLSSAKTLGRILPSRATDLSYKTSGYALEAANLTYSIDNWATIELIPMAVSNTTCNASIPGQTAGVTVQYRIDATDVLKNSLYTNSSYIVKVQPTLNVNIDNYNGTIGKNITVTGTLTPCDLNSVVNIDFMSATETQTISCLVASDGTFTGSFGPQTAGDWSVLANAPETPTSWTANSSQFMVTVKEPPIYVKYSLYIVIGLVVALAVGGAVYYLKFREK
jgi:hypothetical protein